MALFSMARYMGDEEEEAEVPASDSILEKLHAQAAKRKSQLTKEGDDESDERPRKKRKKKDKEQAESDGFKDAGDGVAPSKRSDEEIKVQVEDDATQVGGTEEVEEEDVVKSQQSKKTVGGFTVIGQVKKKKQGKVTRVLPDWLAKASTLSSNTRENRIQLNAIEGIDEEIIEKLKKNGVKEFFPVQAKVIPAVLKSFDPHMPCAVTRGGQQPSDICCSAPTGSGKTLAYVVPILQALRKRVVPSVRALVVVPVRDLAMQVYKVFCSYCSGTNLKLGLMAAYKSLEQEQQHLITHGPDGPKCLVDIVIATPGRLVDHISKTKGFTLKNLRFLVIDEADRMMKEFKFDWVLKVEHAVFEDAPSVCRHAAGLTPTAGMEKYKIPFQKLLFSATLSQNPEKLQQMHLFQPRLLTAVSKSQQNGVHHADNSEHAESQEKAANEEYVGKYVTPPGLNEIFYKIDQGSKPLAVLYLLHTQKFRQVLCFTNSVTSAHRLYLLIKLVGKIKVREITSHVPQLKRNKILKKFAAGEIDIIVCSDQLARGIDVDNAKCVLSYDAANFIQNYIHRIGRTARAGRAGSAITLLDKSQIFFFKKMLQKAGKTRLKVEKIKPSDLKVYVNAYQEALKELEGVLKKEKKKKLKK